MSSTVRAELNRLANGGASYPARNVFMGEAAAANDWAGTTGLDVVGALNVHAGNAYTAYLDLQGVANQLAGTSGLGVVAALESIAA